MSGIDVQGGARGAEMLPPPSPVHVVVREWAAMTQTGHNGLNQDRFGMDGVLFSLADGMGGLAAGDRAAAAAVGSLHAAGPVNGVDLSAAIYEANNDVRQLAAELGQSVGSTITAFVVASGELWLIHVGDTRAYLIQRGAVTRLTIDDTVATESGVPFGHEDYPRLSSALTMSLGGEAVLDREAQRLHIRPGAARLVMTSDGVHDTIGDDRIAAAATGDCAAAAAAVIALAHGARDDATVVVVDVTGVG